MRFEVAQQQNASSFWRELPDVALAEITELGSFDFTRSPGEADDLVPLKMTDYL